MNFLTDMFETLVGSITGDGAIDFNVVLQGFGIYLALLWIALCVWVYADASKRYKNMLVAVLVTLFVFILNFPALIIYLVIRPEEEFLIKDEMSYSDSAVGGVDVPLVKFTGEDGEVKLSLNLQISPSLNKEADMTLDFGITTKREDLKIQLDSPKRKPDVKTEDNNDNTETLTSRAKKQKAGESIFERTRKSVGQRIEAANSAAKKATRRLANRGAEQKD